MPYPNNIPINFPKLSVTSKSDNVSKLNSPILIETRIMGINDRINKEIITVLNVYVVNNLNTSIENNIRKI